MPTISRLLKRRARSIDIVNSKRAYDSAISRRNKNQRLFEDRVRDNLNEDLPILKFRRRTVASAHNNTFVDIAITVDDNQDDYTDLLNYLTSLSAYLQDVIRHVFMSSRTGGMAFNLDVTVHFSAANDPSVESTYTLVSEFYTVFTASDLIPAIDSACEDIINAADEYQNGRSNWVIESIPRTLLKYQSFQPSRSVRGGGKFKSSMTRGRSYLTIPKWLKDIHCVVNIDNKDDRCFEYAMECAFQFKINDNKTNVNPTRSLQYKNKNTFQYGDLEFPIHPLDIEKFEALNRDIHNVAINVYSVSEENHDIGVIYQSKNRSEDSWLVNLLIHTEQKFGAQINAHWLFITSLNRLLASGAGRTSNRKMLFCQRCTQGFYSELSLTEHKESCMSNDSGCPVLPEDYESYKYFSEFSKMSINPFVIYADFEAFNQSLQHSDDETKTEENRLTEHVGASFAWNTVCKAYPEFNRLELQCYEGDTIDDKFQIGKRFISSLEAERDRLYAVFRSHFSFILDGPTDYDSENCCVCKLNLKNGYMPHWKYTTYLTEDECKSSADYYTLRANMKRKPLPSTFQKSLEKENKRIIDLWDTSKATNNFIGKCHFACSRKRPGSPDYHLKIPVVFHNLSNYDSHFILKALNPDDDIKTLNFSGIPQDGDKFMSFSFKGLKFIDSFRFMSASLESLSSNLLKDGKDKFVCFNDHFKNTNSEFTQLFLKKGVFPYDYFKGPHVFKETQLPPIDSFFNTLNDEPLTHEDYMRGQQIWLLGECKTFKDYHDYYLKVDVLLLADVFENFRSICIKQDELDPLNYVSIPGYSMDSAFLRAGSVVDNGKHQPFSVDLFYRGQEDMYTFIEESIRGGVSMTPGRYAKANHKYLPEYNPSDPESHILYLDANNLYGYAMSQPLPHSGYQWVENVEMVDLNDIGEHSTMGYIFEVDGYFPDSTHDTLSDFPLAPVKQAVSEDMLSPFSKEMNIRYNNTHDDHSEKLLCTLDPRIKYKCHYKTLQLYCKHGFVINKVHRILAFEQSNWLASYIDYNTKKRALSTNEFEKDFYKLKNNAVYGKFIQNNRKFREIKVLTSDMAKISWDPRLRSRVIINENFVLGYMKKPTIKLDSPVIIGAAILDHSKYLMYDFYYGIMKHKFGDKLKLLFTDTDSLCMQIFHEDPMEMFNKDGTLDQYFDLSDFPKDESYYGRNYHSNWNKKAIGKFKDEFAIGGVGSYITEVVALRSKMYSCLSTNPKKPQKATAKGVKRSLQRKLTHQKYVACVRQDPSFEIEKGDMLGFRSTNHVIHTINVNKTTLSPCDSKLYLVDNITTKPYGHYSIPKSL